MWLFNKALFSRRCSREAQWAQQLAFAQLACVERRLGSRVQQLGSLAEARGYLRCRALPDLQRGLVRVMPERARWSRSRQERIVRQSLELVADQLAATLVRARGLPVERRQAA